MPQDNGQDNLSKLYTTVKKDGYNLPEYDAFKKDMSDPNKLRKLHDNLSKDGYELPEFDKFKSDMGLGGDVKKKVSTPQATSKDIPSDIPLDGTKPSSNGGTKTPQSKSSSTSKLPSGSSYGEFTTGDILFDAKLNRNYQIQNGKRVYVKDATDNEKATLGG